MDAHSPDLEDGGLFSVDLEDGGQLLWLLPEVQSCLGGESVDDSQP